MTSLTFPSRITRPVTIACLWMVIVLGLTTAHGDATVTTSPPGIVSTVLVGGLEQAVAFTFAPDGRVWFVEKGNADVRIYDPATGRIDDFFHVRGVVAEAEQGLVGIALHPRFPERPYVYLYATRLVHGVPWDQLLRVIDDGGRGTRQRVLWQARASTGHQHSGGRLIFGPDDALYMTVGDALDADVAQDLNSDRGKILRLREDGEPAPGNPFAGSHVYAYGIRNSFGLAFDPRTEQLWETENGPACNDEVNRIEPGANYGWGASGDCRTPNAPASTNVDGPDPVAPELSFTPTIAPTGAAFCDGCGLGRGSEGALFFGGYNDRSIHRAKLDPAREAVTSERIVALARSGLVLSLEVGPDGAIYYSSYTGIFRLELRGASGSPSPTPVSPSPSVATSASPRTVSAPAEDGGSAWPLRAAIVAVIVLLGAAALRLSRDARRGPRGRV